MGNLQCIGESFVTSSEWLSYEPKICGHWLHFAIYHFNLLGDL